MNKCEECANREECKTNEKELTNKSLAILINFEAGITFILDSMMKTQSIGFAAVFTRALANRLKKASDQMVEEAFSKIPVEPPDIDWDNITSMSELITFIEEEPDVFGNLIKV